VALAEKFVDWLESGVRPIRLFDADVFADLSLPHWRVQATGPDEIFAIRETDHHGQGRVRVEHLDRTARGFLLQFEERWVANGQHWYAGELIHAVAEEALITELIIYCTGDWDERAQRRHAAKVQLARP
jgi:hypothetical protein